MYMQKKIYIPDISALNSLIDGYMCIHSLL